jgi:hypothetical protein
VWIGPETCPSSFLSLLRIVPLPPRPPVEHVVPPPGGVWVGVGVGDGAGWPQFGGFPAGFLELGGHALAPAKLRLATVPKIASTNNHDIFFMHAPFNSSGRHGNEFFAQ